MLEAYADWLDQPGDVNAAGGEEWKTHGRKATNAIHELYWNTGLGSGMDNTPRTGNGWVDMSSQMVMQYQDLAYMCQLSGMPTKSQFFSDKAESTAKEINKWCWNEVDGLFYDVMWIVQETR